MRSGVCTLRAELATREQASALCLRPMFGFDWSDVAEVHDPGGVVAFGLPDEQTSEAWLFVPTKPPEKTPACLVAAGRALIGHNTSAKGQSIKDPNLPSIDARRSPMRTRNPLNRPRYCSGLLMSTA